MRGRVVFVARENTETELKDIRASEKNKSQMLDILKRVHDADDGPFTEEAFGGGAVQGDAGDDELEDQGSGLSSQTMAKLLAKIEVSTTLLDCHLLCCFVMVLP